MSSNNIDAALHALLDYVQVDYDGIMVITSRQAIHEVADAFKAETEKVKKLREALEWIKANWSNQDICHTDFRVRSFVEANTALAQSDGKAVQNG